MRDEVKQFTELLGKQLEEWEETGMQNWRENNPYLFFAMLKKQLPYLERELLYETDKIATEAVAAATLAMMIATKSSV